MRPSGELIKNYLITSRLFNNFLGKLVMLMQFVITGEKLASREVTFEIKGKERETNGRKESRKNRELCETNLIKKSFKLNFHIVRPRNPALYNLDYLELNFF